MGGHWEATEEATGRPLRGPLGGHCDAIMSKITNPVLFKGCVHDAAQDAKPILELVSAGDFDNKRH